MPVMKFTDEEQAVLALAGADLPDGPEPFADIAGLAGVGEGEVLGLLNRLRSEGVIRRFGATLRHQKAGYGHNAMVAWLVPEDKDPEAVGRIMAARPEISHCYLRRTHPDWPYNIYTMIHGKNPGDCLRVAEELAALTGVREREVLLSVGELKKTSMSYF
ncbi:MAG: Lrp/AsnC family transcriptional regulator [Desulfovibrionaceae bacterium]|nr:Lrp/AsnC family transcriptional regulator [Desulfovibrionaceae bacterium]